MKRALAAAALVAAAGPTWAADLPQPAPPPPQAPAVYMPAPAPAPVYNWGGVYFGINGGYGFGSSNWSTSVLSTGNFNISGYAVGATVGANLQFDVFVIGLDGDFDAMGGDGTSSACTPVNCETKNTWLSTLRARAGFAMDRVLFYGTAGGAFGNIQGNTSGTSFQSSTEPGWTVGAGIEVAFADNWTARAEYLFVDLENASLPTLLGTSPATPATTTVKFDESIVRLGIDYKFR